MESKCDAAMRENVKTQEIHSSECRHVVYNKYSICIVNSICLINGINHCVKKKKREK